MRYSAVLALTAFALFVASLFLPSVDYIILGKEAPVAGLVILYMALGFGIDVIGNVASGADISSTGREFYLAAFAAIFNFMFLAMPLLLFRRSLAKLGLGISMFLGLVGMAAGIATPFAFGTEITRIDAGFYVWLLGYLMLLAALAAAWREIKTQP